jgi:hypothetical protein
MEVAHCASFPARALTHVPVMMVEARKWLYLRVCRAGGMIQPSSAQCLLFPLMIDHLHLLLREAVVSVLVWCVCAVRGWGE